MDYGKLAYMKAEELEARMQQKEQIKNGGSFAAYYPKYHFIAGAYPLSVLSASGTVNIILKLSVRRNAVVGKKSIRFMIGDSCAAIETVSGEAGESEYLMMTAAAIAGAVNLTLVPDDGLDCTLLKAQISVLGGGALLSRKNVDCAADYLSAENAAGACAYSEEESIYASLLSANGLGETIAVGRGHVLDLCAAGDGYCLVYCDDNLNMWGVRLNADLSLLARRYLGEGAESVAVIALNDELFVAYVINSKVKSFVCNYDFCGMSTREEVDLGLSARHLKFVKHSTAPMLCVTDGTSSYLKLAAEQRRSSGSYTLSGSCSVVSV